MVLAKWFALGGSNNCARGEGCGNRGMVSRGRGGNGLAIAPKGFYQASPFPNYMCLKF